MYTSPVIKQNIVKEKIIDSMAQNIAVIDRNGFIIQTNNQWDNFYKSNGGTIERCGIGVNYLDVCWNSYEETGSEEVSYVIKNIQLILDGEQDVFVYEYPCHSPSEERWYLMYVTPLQEETHLINGAVIVHLDITTKKLSEDHMQYQARISAIGQLVSAIAHELRNPLTTLKGFWALFDAKGDHNLQAFSDVIKSEIEKIEGITNQFLSISDPVNEHHETLDINELLLNTFKLMNYETEKYNIVISYPVVNNSLSFKGIKNQITQAFINIIKNAFEAMPNGGQLSISIQLKEDKLSIQFIDEGCGISPELLPRIGEPFYILNKQGSGFGLMIVQQIINKHKGYLHIESEIDIGTTIEVQLPLI